MKEKILYMFLVFITCITLFNYTVQAVEVNIDSPKEKQTAKNGEEVEFILSVNCKDTDINTLEGKIEYDKNVIENIELEEQNGWHITYNQIEGDPLNGKFFTYKMTEGIDKKENVLVLKAKLSKDISLSTETLIKLKDVYTNNGSELEKVNDENFIIDVEPSETNSQNLPNASNPTSNGNSNNGINSVFTNVNTGDILPIAGILIFVIAIVILLLNNRNKIRIENNGRRGKRHEKK